LVQIPPLNPPRNLMKASVKPMVWLGKAKPKTAAVAYDAKRQIDETLI